MLYLSDYGKLGHLFPKEALFHTKYQQSTVNVPFVPLFGLVQFKKKDALFTFNPKKKSYGHRFFDNKTPESSFRLRVATKKKIS